MGLKVTAGEAAWLVDRHERIVRWHIKKRGDLSGHKAGNSYQIDVDDLANIPGWSVNRQRLAELQQRDARTAESMAARLEALEREVATLRRRIATLEAQNSHQTRSEPNLTEQADTDVPLATYTPVSRPSVPYVAPVSFTMRHRPQGDAVFRTRADGARWLDVHGVAKNTVQGWKQDMDDRGLPLEPSAYLRYAIERKQRTVERGEAWRVPWQLRQCADPLCVCHELLSAGDLEVSAE